MVYIDNDYSLNIANKLNSLNRLSAMRDNLTDIKSNRMTGGAMPISMRKQFEYQPVLTLEQQGNKPIQASNFPIYPHLNLSELAYVNRSRPNPLLYQTLANKRVQTGAGFFEDVGNFLKPVANFLKPVASAGLDALVPIASAYTGSPAIVKGVREGIRGATGVGLKKKGRKSKMVGVGNYEGGCMECMNEIPMEKPKKKAGAKSAGAVKSAGAMTAGKKSKGSRMDLVRKIMKEKGMNLGQASKHIKQNNLY